jgi:hypothetical protein
MANILTGQPNFPLEATTSEPGIRQRAGQSPSTQFHFRATPIDDRQGQ